MNILMVYQSVVDMCASFFMVVIAVVKVDGTGMSSKSSYDQFVCQIWLTRQPMWYVVTASTYGILLTALDRYAAVLHPIWYNSHVRIIVIISMFFVNTVWSVSSSSSSSSQEKFRTQDNRSSSMPRS